MAGVGVMEIRAMTVEDIDAVVRLEQQIYSQPWPSQVFTDELSQDGRRYLVIEDEGRIVGYGGLMLVMDEAHVTTLAVVPDRREARLGTRLMLALVDEALAARARQLTLEVRLSNHPAQSLYRRFGMAPVGLRKNYYLDEDALIMWAHDIDSDEYAHRLATMREEL